MQDRYTGDIGDFGKYGLLRELAEPRQVRVGYRQPLKLGVVWCRTRPEDNADGKHIQYLEPTPANRRRFRACDPELYDALDRIVRERDRCVARVERDGILPHDTAFFGDILTFEETPPPVGESARPAVKLKDRPGVRASWVRRALTRTEGCDLVFFDPDNGLPTAVSRYGTRGPKFIFYDEPEPFVRRGQTLIIYQHAHRNGTVEQQLRRRFADLGEHLGPGRRHLACVFRRWGVRAFIIVPVGRVGDLVAERARAFVVLPGWREHFYLVE